MLSVTAQSTAPLYDGRGNMTRDHQGQTYQYDHYNRLSGVGTSIDLTYDPAGRLQETSGTGITFREMQYDGLDLIAEYNGSGTLTARYVHGPGADEPLVQYAGSAVSTRQWLLADERGSIVAVTDWSGASIQINSYDEYGAPAPGNAGRFGYTGQVWLPETGLYHYKNRAYNPELGRFMQTDPIGVNGGMNLYAYVGGDPVNFVDPLGLEVVSICTNWWSFCGGWGRGSTGWRGGNLWGDPDRGGRPRSVNEGAEQGGRTGDRREPEAPTVACPTQNEINDQDYADDNRFAEEFNGELDESYFVLGSAALFGGSMGASGEDTVSSMGGGLGAFFVWGQARHPQTALERTYHHGVGFRVCTLFCWAVPEIGGGDTSFTSDDYSELVLGFGVTYNQPVSINRRTDCFDGGGDQ